METEMFDSESLTECRQRFQFSAVDIMGGSKVGPIEDRARRSMKNCVRFDDHFWLSMLIVCIFLPVVMHVWILSCYNFSLAPAADDGSMPATTSSVFEPKIALKILSDFTKIGPRVTGSRANEVLALRFLKEKLTAIKDLVSNSPSVKTELDVQIADHGTFTIEFLDTTFASVYRKIVNVVFRVHGQQWHRSNGSEQATPALLVNCHFDSALISPGAGDDALSCAVQIEVLRAMLVGIAQDKKTLPFHDIIFLFNGAEENILQGSHAFITQHRWAKDVKAFINLDSAGSSGPMIAFQMGPQHPWLTTEYAHAVPYPLGNVFGQMVFEKKLIPSDTDFHIFRDYGHIPGIDLAHFKNGYVYHSVFDTADRICQMCVQVAGENLKTLTTALANSPHLRDPGHQAKGSAVFFDVLSLFMIVYSRSLAALMHVLSAAWVLALIIGRYVKTGRLSLLGKSLLGLVGCLAFVYLVMLTAACVVSFVLCRPLSWYNLSANIVGLYVLPMCAAFFIYWYFFLLLVMPRKGYNFVLEAVNPVLDAARLMVSFLMLVDTFVNGGFYFLFVWLLVPAVMEWALTACLKYRLVLRKNGCYYHLTVYLCSFSLPLLTTLQSLVIFLEIMIPVLGRSLLGFPDLVIVSSLFLFGAVPLLFFSSLAVRSSLRSLRRLGILLFHCSIAWAILMTVFRIGDSYSNDSVRARNQRVLISHLNRDFRDDPTRPDVITRSDSGFLMSSLDANPMPLSERQQRRTVPLLCEGPDPYCGVPLFYPAGALFKQYLYLHAERHHLQPAPQLRLVSFHRPTSSALNMTFAVSGPPQAHIFFSTEAGVELRAWSVGDESKQRRRPKPAPLPSGATGRHYFVFNGHGGEKLPGPLLLWALFELRPGQHVVRVAVAGHYSFDRGVNSRPLQTVMREMTSIVNSIHLSSWYSMWTFRVDAQNNLH